MKQLSLNFGFEARYFQLGELTKKTKNLIFVLHGHGQLAGYFIKKFSSLDNEENCIIAPEGLSRYYLEGYTGRVGATWMTKEDRLRDINNYITYLNTLFLTFGHRVDELNVTVLGFSQGAATAARWVANAAMKFDRLILWAGIFPPDMNIDQTIHRLSGKVIKYVYGVNDPFLTTDVIEEMRQIATKLKVQPEVIPFEGVHEIQPELFPRVFDL